MDTGTGLGARRRRCVPPHRRDDPQADRHTHRRSIIEDRPSAWARRHADSLHGEELAVETSAAPIHDRQGGVIGAVMVAHDVTIARELSRKLARLALHDSLTDVPNRTLLSDRLDQAMMRAQRTAAASRCSISIWIASNTSMTPWVTPSGTSCSNQWRTACRIAYAAPIP